MNDDKAATIKAGVAWIGVGISNFLDAIGIHAWGDLAGMLASIYSAFLIFDRVCKMWRERQ